MNLCEITFATIGEVKSASVIKDKMSGRSRGFGFVEMMTEEAAAEAVAKLNDTDLDGRIIPFVLRSHNLEKNDLDVNSLTNTK